MFNVTEINVLQCEHKVNVTDLITMTAPSFSNVSNDTIQTSPFLQPSVEPDATHPVSIGTDDLLMGINDVTSSILISSTVDRLMCCSTISEGCENSVASPTDVELCSGTTSFVDNPMDSPIPDGPICLESKEREFCYKEVFQPQMNVLQEVTNIPMQKTEGVVEEFIHNDVTMEDVTELTEASMKHDMEIGSPEVVDQTSMMLEYVCKDKGPDKMIVAEIEMVAVCGNKVKVAEEPVQKDGGGIEMMQSGDTASEPGRRTVNIIWV